MHSFNNYVWNAYYISSVFIGTGNISIIYLQSFIDIFIIIYYNKWPYIRSFIYKEDGIHSISKFLLQEICILAFFHCTENITYTYNTFSPSIMDITLAPVCMKFPVHKILPQITLMMKACNHHILNFLLHGPIQSLYRWLFQKSKQNKTCIIQSIFNLTTHSIFLLIALGNDKQ